MEDFRLHRAPVSMIHVDQEVILSFAVLLLWIRKLKVLQVFKLTGSFVFMIFEMMVDVVKVRLALGPSSGSFGILSPDLSCAAAQPPHLAASIPQ